MRVADYWEVARLFEGMFDKIQRSPQEFQWDEATQAITNHSASLQHKYGRTLAAFGVEVHFRFHYRSDDLVWSWSVTNIRLSVADRDELRDHLQSFFETTQHSVQTLSQALKFAEEQTLGRLEEIKGHQSTL